MIFRTSIHAKMELEKTPQSKIDKGPAQTISTFWTEQLIQNNFHVKKVEKVGNRKWSIFTAPNDSFIKEHQDIF